MWRGGFFELPGDDMGEKLLSQGDWRNAGDPTQPQAVARYHGNRTMEKEGGKGGKKRSEQSEH